MPKPVDDKTAKNDMTEMTARLRARLAQQLAARGSVNKRRGSSTNPELEGEHPHEEVAGFELDPDQIDADLRGEGKDNPQKELQEQAELEELSKVLETTTAPAQYEDEKNEVFEEPTELAKGLYFSMDVGASSTITRERCIGADLFSEIPAGKDEALCFELEVTGEAEYVYTAHTGEIAKEKGIKHASYLIPIAEGLGVIAGIARERIEPRIEESNIDYIHGEFPLSLSSQHPTEPSQYPTEGVKNLTKKGIGDIARQEIGSRLLFGVDEEVRTLNKKHIEKLGISLATAA